MSKELDRVRKSVSDALAEPRADAPWSPPKGFVTFRYSSTEIFAEDGNLHVRMRETRYENGRLKSEECEGTVDRQAYNRMVGEAQAYFLGQLAGFTRMLFAPLLSTTRERRRDE